MDAEAKSEIIKVLLVEDSPSDASLTQRALERTSVQTSLHHAESGEDALQYLQATGDPLPDLVLLDLNLPGMHGQEVLAMLRQNESLSSLPVIVLTSSDADEDVLRSFEYQANGYMVKCFNQEEFTKKLDFWISIVRRQIA